MTPSAPAADEAVSPVLATILMVAITVALASVLYAIVSGIGQAPQQAPVVQFVRDELNGQLTVVKAFEPIDLARLEVRASADARVGHNAAPATVLPAGAYVPVSATPGTELRGGDQLRFCAVAPGQKVDVSIRVTQPKEILVYQNSFTNLDPC